MAIEPSTVTEPINFFHIGENKDYYDSVHVPKLSDEKMVLDEFEKEMAKVRQEVSEAKMYEEFWSSTEPIGDAPFTLRDVERKSINRKSFDGRALSCTFCAKKGHDASFCPSKPNEKKGQHFTQALLSVPQIDVLRYKGKTWQEAKEMIEELGTTLNAGNPWQGAIVPKHQLKRNLGFWKAIGTNKTVLSWIANGVPLRFATTPPRLAFRNHPSYENNKEFIGKEMQKHVADGSFIVVSAEQARVVHPLQVEPKGESDVRMCVDARFVNTYLPKVNFQLETLQKNGADVISRDSAQFTTDIQKAYYAIEMDEEACPFLCWKHLEKIYMATVLVFGLSIAPAVFHKIMREVVRFLRTLGINVLNYIDDFLWNECMEKIQLLIAFVRWLLPRLGWAFNKKCVWEPSKVVTFLGLLADTEKFEYRVPEDKLKRAAYVISVMRERADRGAFVSLEDVRAITGRLMSFRLAVEPVRVWTRALYREIARAEQRHFKWVKMNPDACEELRFWEEQLTKKNGFRIAGPLGELCMKVDSSETGYGAVLEGKKVAGVLPTYLIGTSSTRRELAGLLLASEQLQGDLSGKRVRFQMDSFAAVRNLMNGGGPKADLTEEVKQWWRWCEKSEIQPTYEWIPREENKIADSLSKELDKAWKIKANVKRLIEEQWPGTEIENPLFNAISTIMRNAKTQRRRIVLVVPGWPSQSWWLQIQKHGREQIELSENAFEPITTAQRIGTGKQDWHFYAILLDFSCY
jgi:hypothetical protein